MDTPVVLIVFNRPRHVSRVLERVAEARPQKLFVIADGPRNAEDRALCAQVRGIVSNLPWPAEIHFNFSEVNLGGARRVSSGLDWVFERVPEAIILEDDCLPGPDFFPFCEEMLERYRFDSRIGVISGDNFVAPGMHCPDSYYFSKYPHVWGWATWRRTWSLFDFEMRSWHKAKSLGLLNSVLSSPETIAFWTDTFDTICGASLAWDAKLVYTCLINNLLNVLPAQNLVSNIGWGPEASHALDLSSPLANIPIGKLGFPLRHPDFVYCWKEADEATELLAQFESFDAEVKVVNPRVRFELAGDHATLLPEGRRRIHVTVTNLGEETLSSRYTCPVVLSYHWMSSDRQVRMKDGERSVLPFDILPGCSATMDATIAAPPDSSCSVACLTLVQESVCWFDDCDLANRLYVSLDGEDVHTLTS